MKSRLLALLLTSFASFAIAAPPSVESVEQLLVLSRSKALFDSSSERLELTVRQGLLEGLGNTELSDEGKQLLDALPPKLVKVIQPEFSWAALKPELVRLYAEEFSQEEVNGMIAFYKSPTGQALINKMPRVLDRSVQMTQERLAAAVPRLQAAMLAALEELKTKGK
jgi:hypothetical protein